MPKPKDSIMFGPKFVGDYQDSVLYEVGDLAQNGMNMNVCVGAGIAAGATWADANSTSGSVSMEYPSVIYVGEEALDEQDVKDLKALIKLMRANPGLASILDV